MITLILLAIPLLILCYFICAWIGEAITDYREARAEWEHFDYAIDEWYDRDYEGNTENRSRSDDLRLLSNYEKRVAGRDT